MSSYLVISPADAKRYLRPENPDTEPDIEGLERRVGSGPEIDTQPLSELREQLSGIKDQFPQFLPAKSTDGGKFEQLSCSVVHEALKNYPSIALADPDFWLWTSLTFFEDIIEWRFGTRGRKAHLENYGIGTASKRRENLIYRLWLRGDMGFEVNADDPYRLARAGDQDLWRSHLIRREYASARPVARAILRLQAGMFDLMPLGTDQVREFVKHLQRLRANVMLEMLDDSGADQVVIELARDVGKLS